MGREISQCLNIVPDAVGSRQKRRQPRRRRTIWNSKGIYSRRFHACVWKGRKFSFYIKRKIRKFYAINNRWNRRSERSPTIEQVTGSNDYWMKDVDLKEPKDEAFRSKEFDMLRRHAEMWSRKFGCIASNAYRFQLKHFSAAAHQMTYSQGL